MASKFLTLLKQTIVCISFHLEWVQSPFYGQTGLECTTEVKQILMHTDPPPHTYATSHLLSHRDSFSETALRQTSPLKAGNFQKKCAESFGVCAESTINSSPVKHEQLYGSFHAYQSSEYQGLTLIDCEKKGCIGSNFETFTVFKYILKFNVTVRSKLSNLKYLMHFN